MKKRNLSQEKIIDCFRELAEEMDVQQITFQHLAKRLDIKAPSLYNHFKNIRDVKTALTAKLLQELNDQLRRALVGKSGQEALQIYAE
ncbi:TetR/AcrR family transcriptional regulator, partial [Salmonella enterica subsp. enterica serovar Istanbul]|nr:TetR/AcrR family transcriptional regulator [Salmonella enterica subsp. enterica serovar Istanbul]